MALVLLTQAASKQAVQLHSKTYSVGTKPFYISNKVHNTLVDRTVPSTILTPLIPVPIEGNLDRKQPYFGSHLMTKSLDSIRILHGDTHVKKI